MSTRLKLNVKNITSGLQNFSDILGHESKIHNGFSRLVVPRSIPLRRPDCKYYQQDYVRRSNLDYARLVLTPAPGNQSLKRISSDIPLPGKWLDTVHSIPACTGKGCPWESAYSFYYDTQNPQCPPPSPKLGGDAKDTSPKTSGCPEPSPKSDGCPDTSQQQAKTGSSCEGKSKPKTDPCSRKKCSFVIPLNFYRHYSSKCKKGSGGHKSSSGKDSSSKEVKACKPRGGKGSKGSKQSKGGRKGGGKPKVCGPRKGAKKRKASSPSEGGSRCKSRGKGSSKKGGSSKSRSSPRKCTPKGKSSSPARKSSSSPKSKCTPRGKSSSPARKSSSSPKSKCTPRGKSSGKSSPSKSASSPKSKCTPRAKSSPSKSSSSSPQSKPKCTPKSK